MCGQSQGEEEGIFLVDDTQCDLVSIKLNSEGNQLVEGISSSSMCFADTLQQRYLTTEACGLRKLAE